MVLSGTETTVDSEKDFPRPPPSKRRVTESAAKPLDLEPLFAASDVALAAADPCFRGSSVDELSMAQKCVQTTEKIPSSNYAS